MRTGKLAMLILAAVLAGSMIGATAASAQPEKTEPDRAERRLEMLKDRLKLDDNQVQKIRAIMEESRKGAEAERSKHMGDREAAEKFRTEHRKATDEKIKGVLNDEQKKEYDKIKEDRRQNFPDRKGRREGVRRGSGQGGPRRGGR